MSLYAEISVPAWMTRFFEFSGRHFWTSSWLFAEAMHCIWPCVRNSGACDFSVKLNGEEIALFDVERLLVTERYAVLHALGFHGVLAGVDRKLLVNDRL